MQNKSRTTFVSGVRVEDHEVMLDDDLPTDAATCCTVKTPCACEDGTCPSWMFQNTQEVCQDCGAVNPSKLEIGVTYEDEVDMRGTTEQEHCLETDDKYVVCLLPAKLRGACKNCVDVFNEKLTAPKNDLSKAHETRLLDPVHFTSMESNVFLIDQLMTQGVFTPSEIVHSKQQRMEEIRVRRLAMSTAMSNYAAVVDGVRTEHFVSFKNVLDMTWLQLGKFSGALRDRSEKIERADRMGVLWAASKNGYQVRKDVENWIVGKPVHVNENDKPPSTDCELTQSISDRFMLELSIRDKKLFEDLLEFIKVDTSSRSDFRELALADEKRGLMKKIFVALDAPQSFSCGLKTCNWHTNVGFCKVNKQPSHKYKDIFKQLKLSMTLAEIGDVLLTRTEAASFRARVIKEAKVMFWKSDFFEKRVEGALSTIQKVIYGAEFSHIGCNFDAGFMNRLCLSSVARFFEIYMAPLFDAKNYKCEQIWRNRLSAFVLEKATSTADSIAIVKLLEVTAIKRCATVPFPNDDTWRQQLAKYPTHNFEYLESCFSTDTFIKEASIVTKNFVVCSFDHFCKSLNEEIDFNTLCRESQTSPHVTKNKRLIKNTIYQSLDIKWEPVFARLPTIEGSSAIRFVFDENGKSYTSSSDTSKPTEEDMARSNALPLTEVSALTKLATELEVALAVLVYGTRQTRATFIGFVGLSTASRANINTRYELDVFANAVASNAETVTALWNRQEVSEFLQRVLSFIELRLLVLQDEKTQDDDDDVEQSAKIRRLDIRIKYMQEFEAATTRFLRTYIVALDRFDDKSKSSAIILQGASTFQAARLTVNRKEIDHSTISLRGTPKRPLSVALIPSKLASKGILQIEATNAIELALEKSLSILHTASRSNCTKIATRVSMNFLSPTMQRLNHERAKDFTESNEDVLTREQLARVDMAASFHRVLAADDDSDYGDAAIELFQRVHETVLAPIDKESTAGYLKLVNEALAGGDPISAPVLRNSTIVRFLAECASRWGSPREKRCAATILSNNYDYNKNNFVDTPNKPLVAIDVIAAVQSSPSPPELFQAFHADSHLRLAAAAAAQGGSRQKDDGADTVDDAMRDRSRAHDALRTKYSWLTTSSPSPQKNKKNPRNPGIVKNAHMCDADGDDFYCEG